MGMNRKGYFFVVDAILASIILAVGMFVLYGSYVKATPTEQAQDVSDDFLLLISSQQLGDSSNAYLRTVLLPSGALAYADSTAIEELTYLQQKYLQTGDATYNGYARNFTESLLNDSIDARYGASLSINGTTLFTRTNTKNDFYINRSIIVYARMNRTTTVGPLIAEVDVWQ